MHRTELPIREHSAQFIGSDVLPNRLFLILLIAITLGALIPLLVIGNSEPLSYNAYWDSFTSLQNRRLQWWMDVRDSAHPPLFFLIQHFAMNLGKSWLALRMVVIACGAGSTFLIGLIAAKAFQNRWIALLCAAAFGFAIPIIELNTDVRPYPLALFLMLAAFLPFIGFMRDPLAPDSGAAFLRFLLFTLLAQLSEHFALFFYVACLASIFLNGVCHADFRKAIFAVVRRRPIMAVVAPMLPFATFWTLSVIQLQYVAALQGHLSEFYLSTSGLSPWRYISLNFARDLNFFLPFKINSMTEIIGIFASIPFLGYLLLVRGNARKRLVSTLPILILFFLLLELMTLGVANRYPFGGELRQQSIIAPFLVLSGFAILDQLLAFLPGKWLRGVAIGAVALLIGAGFHNGWAKPSPSPEMFEAQYKAFNQEFPSSPIVFVDYFSCFGLYAATHTWTWRVERSVLAGSRIWIYQTQSPDGQKRLVLRDKDSWNLDFTQPDPYPVMASTLTQTKFPRLDVFWVRQGGQLLTPDDARKDTAHIADLAKGAGLVLEAGDYNGVTGFLRFRLN